MKKDDQIAMILVGVFATVLMLGGVGIYNIFVGGPISFGYSWAWPIVVMFLALLGALLIYLGCSGFYIPRVERNKIKARHMNKRYEDSLKEIEVTKGRVEIKAKFDI